MRSKKLAVRFGLLSVLLMSLSAAAAPDLARTSQGMTGSDVASPSYARTIFFPRVATPKYICTPTWRGAVIVRISCSTRGATIRYTWNRSSWRTYLYPLYVTRDAVLIAYARKPGWQNSYGRKLTIDFWPYKN